MDSTPPTYSIFVRFTQALLALLLGAMPASARDETESGCNVLMEIVFADLRSGRSVSPDVIAWGIAAEAKLKDGAPCPPVPSELLARAQATPASPGAPALAVSNFPLALEEVRARWQTLWDELTSRSVGGQMQYGIAGQSNFRPGDPLDSYGKPTELEKLSLELKDERLFQLGRRFQLRSYEAHRRFCAEAPLEQCRAQEAGIREGQSAFASARMADPQYRAEMAAKYGVKPEAGSRVQVIGGLTGGGNVTMRVYDRNGNYQGSVRTSATEAGLMGAR
jgi:hypothetical protein